METVEMCSALLLHYTTIKLQTFVLMHYSVSHFLLLWSLYTDPPSLSQSPPHSRYVIIDYFFQNDSMTYCPDMDRNDCCKKQWEQDVCKTNSHNSWIWTRSSVYLLISPGALDYLSFQKFAYQFTAIPRINQACVCLPRACHDSNQTSIARQMTSKVKQTSSYVCVWCLNARQYAMGTNGINTVPLSRDTL